MRRPLLRLLGALAALVLLVAGAVSCGLFVSFDDYATDGPYFAVSGTVDGLEGATLRVTLNGGNAQELREDVSFSFPRVLADNDDYSITLEAPPGHSCWVEGGNVGRIARADAHVVIHCPSTNAALQRLSLSAGPLSPKFDPAHFAYTVLLPSIDPPRTTTVTATASALRAQLMVAGVVSSATASAIVPLPTPISILVTAPDRRATSTYTVDFVSAYLGDYVKASNTRAGASFGGAVALSGDTLVVGSSEESSNATGVNGNQADTSARSAGAVYVFTRTAGVWSQQAYLKASNTRPSASFGGYVALSGDTLAVGSYGESSNATGVNGNQADTSAAFAGAVYVFTRTGTVWSQQAYLKASNTRPGASFGVSVALSGDALAVGSIAESSNATGVNGNQADTSASYAGAVYVFTRAGTVWSQQAYLKASNTRPGAFFGASVALSGDTLAAGSSRESSNATGVNGNQADTSASYAGAAYVFTRTGPIWSQQAYVKASNTRQGALFGASIALAGETLAVGSFVESSSATGVNGNQADMSADSAGAAYVFTRTGAAWSQQAYLKASNTRRGALFGGSVALAGDRLAVGSFGESSSATGANGSQADGPAPNAGAAYLFMRSGTAWSQHAYLKASNTRESGNFGSVALSGGTLAVGSDGESSNATGVNGNQADTSAPTAGAVYLFR